MEFLEILSIATDNSQVEVVVTFRFWFYDGETTLSDALTQPAGMVWGGLLCLDSHCVLF